MQAKLIFESVSGNSGLTEEKIYSLIQNSGMKYKVLSGATNKLSTLGETVVYKRDNGKLITTFRNRPGILVIRKGKAGKLNLLLPDNYTINDDAYILYLKDSFIRKMNLSTVELQISFLKYFIFAHQHDVYDYASSSDNSTWSKTAFFNNFEMEIPSIEDINRVSSIYGRAIAYIEKLEMAIAEIEKLLNKEISLVDFCDTDEDRQINTILTYKSRNDSLSEEGIYNAYPKNDDVITVLSGSINNVYYGKVSSNTKNLHVLEDIPALHVISRGRAGTLTFIPAGRYATNTNAFLFYLKRDKLEELNIFTYEEECIYLKFLKLYLQPIFIHASTQSNLSVFPLTNLMRSLKIPKFKFNNEMRSVVAKFDSIEDKYLDLLKSKQSIETALEKSLALNKSVS
ncbi:hypothetical protein [Sporosarcina sp. USHLN248]|uniref:hypothetical protein n=1 Tax=Sporosarcina sp. USHLN248 TaxID=3081300 RepID=UPI003016FC30